MVSHKDAKGIPSSKIYEYLGLGKPVMICPGDEDILDNTFKPYNLGSIANTSEEAFNQLNLHFAKYLRGESGIQIADKNKIHLIGFGLHDNPLNLRKKFSFRGLADGRFWLVKKSNYKFDLNAQLIDDVAWTSENLIRHGNVLILNWTVPYFKRYSAGGFGSTEERKAQRKKECNYLANRFYPLVRVADKSNWDFGTHIKIFGSDKNIHLARKKIFR
jgi:hypothetical protein